MTKKQKPIGAVIVSDLHCGSTVGLWPDGHETSTGNTIGLGKNLHQQWLWQCWKDKDKKIKWCSPHLGDLHERGLQLLVVDARGHGECAQCGARGGQVGLAVLREGAP